MSPAELMLLERTSLRGPVLAAIGEVRMDTRQPLLDRLREVVAQSQSPEVFVDLGRVDYIDSAGLAVLVEAQKDLKGQGRTLHLLVRPRTQPERILRLGRFDTLMRMSEA